MDIKPLYELKDRLRVAAIAGTELIPEDFRLKKAADSFKALEGASPVFKKISEQTDALLSDKCSDRAGALLDTVTLVDSVICTLGTSEVSGEVGELPITDTASRIVDAPYSRLSSIIDALTKSGSGNMETVSNAWAETPELFRDYRVKPAVVKGLGASYSELAEYVVGIITDIGGEMLPLLEKDFDPEGKKEMVRRVMAIDRIGGASENEFYLKTLESAKKDVRKMLIYALRHDESNVDTLIGFTKTEKGKLKDAAIYALGTMDCEKAEQYYNELAKDPAALLIYLKEANAKWAGKLTARIIDEVLVDSNDNKITLSQYHADPKIKLKSGPVFQVLENAMHGKTGAEIEQLYRDFRLTVTNTPVDWQMDQCLQMSIYITRDEGLIKLAIELNNAPETKGKYDRAEAMARLMSREDCSGWLDMKLAEVDKKMRASGEFNMNEPLMSVLWWLHFRNGKYVMERYYYDVLTDGRPVERKTISQPVKEKFIDSLVKYDNIVYTRVIGQLIDFNDKELCRKVGEYYIREFRTVPGMDNVTVIQLKYCGFKNVEGLLADWCRMNPNIEKWGIMRFIEYMPADEEFKVKETRDLVEKLRSGEIKCRLTAADIDWLANWIEENPK